MRKSYAGIQKTMKVRRELIGPEKLRKRSDWPQWDYQAELFAFNKRLNENLTAETLQCIFVHDSYIRMEEEKRKDMSEQNVQLDLNSNKGIIAHGVNILIQFIPRYLRQTYQFLPEEGISAVCQYLISDDVLSHVSYNIGTKDLIFSAEFPPDMTTLSATFKAIVGGIATDESVSRAENFVLDFVCPQLIEKDIFEIWDLPDPLQVLNRMFKQQSREPVESRLLFESGRNTLEAVYHVGLYSKKQFLGRGVGETLSFAEEMAAYDVLRRFFHLNESRMPLPLGRKARNADFSSIKQNMSICELCGM